MQTDNSDTILCPVDFSEQSANALREAALLSRACNSAGMLLDGSHSVPQTL